METTDVRLTLFLINCMSGIHQGSQKPLPKENRPRNLSQFKIHDGDLIYLESTAIGENFRCHTDVRVMQGSEGDRHQIWSMQIISMIHNEGLPSSISRSQLREFIFRARLAGYEQTRARIAEGKSFCLFDIPKREEDGLTYEETIDDNLHFFTGDETVKYKHPRSTRSERVYTAYYQGGRL